MSNHGMRMARIPCLIILRENHMHLSRRFVAAVIALTVIAALSGVVYAQEQEQTISIKDILAKAECPLTDAQTKTLGEMKAGGDFSMFQELATLFDAKQDAALKEVFGTSPGFGDMPEQPRFLFFTIIFENEGCPFTSDQAAKIKAINDDDPMAMFGEMQNIFTEEQAGILQAMMPNQ